MDYVITSIDQLFVLLLDIFWSIVGSVLLYTVIGLIVSIAVMVFVKSKKLARRKNMFWNFLTNLHYPLILIAFLVTGPILGGTRALHSMVSGIVSHYLSPTIEEKVGNIQHAIISAWSEEASDFPASTQDTVDHLVKTLHYTPAPDEFFGEEKADLLNWLIDDLGSSIVGSTVSAMASVAIGEVESIGALVFPVQEIRATDYSYFGKRIAQSVDATVSSYIDSFFSGFYVKILGILALFMAIPVVEMLFFNLWWKNRTIFTQKVQVIT